MLYVFSGNDVVAVREKAHTFLTAREEKGANIRRIEAEGYDSGAVISLAESVSLFGEPETIVLDMLSDVDGALEEIVEHADSLAESAHTFVIIEGKILEKSAKPLKAAAKEYVAIDTTEKTFNIFSLTDALARKDRKLLWILLMRARKAGFAPEEIIGTLFWQLKSLRTVKLAKSAKEAGMKDFTYNKAKSAAAKFTSEELQKLSRSLVLLYHEGHGGLTDIDLALEKWVLNL